MNTDQAIQLHLLRIASLVASKNMEIATANMELQHCEHWRTDHQTVINGIDAEIEANEKAISNL